MIIDNLLEADEAWEACQDGHFLTSGGYTYYKGGYFAYGTFPGCMRTGEITRSSFEGKRWIKLNFKELVKHTGYFPCAVLKMNNILVNTPYQDEALFHEVNMIQYMIDSEYKVRDFKDMFKAERIWDKYFNPKDMDDDTGSSIS